MTETKKLSHQELLNQFIAKANELKDNGSDINDIATALMSASAVYTTYTFAGNEGYLKESGIQKVIQSYEGHVRRVQSIKAEQANQTNNEKPE